MTFLAASKVVAGYGSHDEISKGVDLEVSPGEIVAILGPNGAGKSTLLKAIAGLVAPRSGTVALAGHSIAGLAPRDISRRGVVFVPQDANIFPSMTVEENLEIGAYLDRRSFAEQMQRVCARIPELAGRRRAKLALSPGAAATPRHGHGPDGRSATDAPRRAHGRLSPAAAERLFAMIRAIASDGIAIALVEQNALHALMVSDRAYILVDGRNARTGRAKEIAADPDIRRIFLGVYSPSDKNRVQKGGYHEH